MLKQISTLLCVSFLFLSSIPATAVELNVQSDKAVTMIGITGHDPFHTTDSVVSAARLIEVPDTTVLLALWNEHTTDGLVTPLLRSQF